MGIKIRNTRIFKVPDESCARMDAEASLRDMDGRGEGCQAIQPDPDTPSLQPQCRSITNILLNSVQRTRIKRVLSDLYTTQRLDWIAILR